MKKIIILILFLFLGLPPQDGQASGSNTVFLPIKIRQYIMTDACPELLNNPELFDYLQHIQSPVYIARIHAYLFDKALVNLHYGYDVQIAFEGFESILFSYYADVDTVVGFTANGSPVILLPSLKQ
ncbi:MAG: hypothetical protein NTX25_09670 [Proteobacteria bacterium]|nr:hypothetical protein [Pseudomonadota bacterium]